MPFNSCTWEAKASGSLSSRPCWSTKWVPARATQRKKEKRKRKVTFHNHCLIREGIAESLKRIFCSFWQARTLPSQNGTAISRQTHSFIFITCMCLYLDWETSRPHVGGSYYSMLATSFYWCFWGQPYKVIIGTSWNSIYCPLLLPGCCSLLLFYQSPLLTPCS